MSDADYKKIEVPLDWVQIDNMIVLLRLSARIGLVEAPFAVELANHLQKYSMKAKLVNDEQK